MNREDIIRMAREAGFREPAPSDGCMGLAFDYRDGNDTGASLERFFQAAYAAGAAAATEEANRRANASWSLMCEKMVAAEREACAKVCEQLGTATNGIYERNHECAAAIRARSATK
jgi:hypothetical protein